MRRDIAARSRLLAAWGFLLNVPTLIGALIFVRTIEGASVTGAVIVSLIIAGQIHKRAPMSRLIGLCHIVFLPAIFVLAAAVGEVWSWTGFNVWLVYSLALMSICVLIDGVDLMRYFFGGTRTYVE